MKLQFLLIFFIACTAVCHATTYSVANISELNTAIDAVVPGDTIEMEDGTWSDHDIIFDANGTASANITLRAKNPGQVIISGVTDFRIGGDYLIVSGLVFENCTTDQSNLIAFRRTSSDLANHSRLTDCVIKDCNPPSTTTDYKWVGIFGTHNEVDHCYFENKNHEGPTVVVWTTTIEGHHTIHHNYFGTSPEGDGNGWETIRVGTSSFAQNDGFNTVEHNYFYQRDGEIEIISGKSSNCTYNYNIFRACKGGLTLRHGTDCTVTGNIFIGEDKSGTYGIRTVDRDHVVTNNYMEGLNHGGSSYRHPLTLMGGETNNAANGYQHNINNVLAYNTILNCTRGIMLDPDSDHDVPPEDAKIVNNVVSITGQAPVVYGSSTPVNPTFEGNYFYRVDGGVSVPPSGYVDIDPEMYLPSGDSLYRPESTSPLIADAVTGYPGETADFELHNRPAMPTVGYDEISTDPPIDRGIYGPTWMNGGGPPPPPPTPTTFAVLMEAEDAVIGSEWTEVMDTDACGGSFLLPPETSSTGTPPTDPEDLVTFTFSLPQAGTYKVFARTSTFSVNDDSFWVRVNGGSWVRWNAINGPNYPAGYHWEQVGQWNGGSTADPVTFEMIAGTNTVQFSWREEFARLDKIFVTQEDLSVMNVVRNNTLDEQFSFKDVINEACPNDIINFADTTNMITFPLDANTINIGIPLTIIGNGTNATMIDGMNAYQALINSSSNLKIQHLTFINNFSSSEGGALINNGTLRLEDVIFEHNYEGFTPKAFTNNGTLILEGSDDVIIKD